MKRRLFLAVLSAVVVIAMSTRIGGCHAAPFSGAALRSRLPRTSALIKVQTACGWTYSCTNLGSGGNGPQQVQIYGPVNIYTGADVKPEIWRVPEGAWPWTGDQGNQEWRGWGCGGHPCDERCGAVCWFNRIRNGYCGHGCNVYREHVMFQPIGGDLRPYVYRSQPGGDYGYGSPDGYGYGYGAERPGIGRVRIRDGAPRDRADTGMGAARNRAGTDTTRRPPIPPRARGITARPRPNRATPLPPAIPRMRPRITAPPLPRASASLIVCGAIFTGGLVAKRMVTTLPSVTMGLSALRGQATTSCP